MEYDQSVEGWIGLTPAIRGETTNRRWVLKLGTPQSCNRPEPKAWTESTLNSNQLQRRWRSTIGVDMHRSRREV